jgi:hypothetical protein
LRDVVLRLLLLLVVGLLLVDLLGCEVLLLLVCVGGAVAIRLFAGVGVCGGDDELEDFERVGVLGGGCADAEVIAFGEFDLNTC